jgi:hypothetical protein
MIPFVVVKGRLKRVLVLHSRVMRSGGNEGAMSRGGDGGHGPRCKCDLCKIDRSEVQSTSPIIWPFRLVQREENNNNSKKLCFVSRYQTQVAVVETR